jgi:hypothetical protein
MSSDEKARSQRAVTRPRLPPGPLADLKALIYEVYTRAGTPDARRHRPCHRQRRARGPGGGAVEG